MSGRDDAAVRVVVADRHPLFRRGVVQAVEQRAELTLAGDRSGVGESPKLTRW